jgi:hypothetical protein
MHAGIHDTANAGLLEHLQGSGAIVTDARHRFPVAYDIWITKEPVSVVSGAPPATGKAEVSGFVYSEADSRFVAAHFDGRHVLELSDGRRLRFSFLNERGAISPLEWLPAV